MRLCLSLCVNGVYVLLRPLREARRRLIQVSADVIDCARDRCAKSATPCDRVTATHQGCTAIPSPANTMTNP